MAGRLKWQRGNADLLSVAAGLFILTTVTFGTTAAMIYGREAMLREEHYKTAAYILRGEMEAQQSCILMVSACREDLLPRVVTTKPLDLPSDRGGVEPVYVTISRDRIERVPIPWDQAKLNYYAVTMHANWTERDYAENSSNTRISREITFKTAVIGTAFL